MLYPYLLFFVLGVLSFALLCYSVWCMLASIAIWLLIIALRSRWMTMHLKNGHDNAERKNSHSRIIQEFKS
jgi:ABC-type uncharacterized transport system permease subunit